MALTDLAAHDIEAHGLRTDDGAVAGTYLPAEQGAAGVGFLCYVRPGADTVAFIAEDSGQLENRRIEALALLTVLQAGIQTLTGVTRGPERGDLLRLTAPGLAGDWVVVDATPSHLGGVTLRLRYEAISALSAPGVREVRG